MRSRHLSTQFVCVACATWALIAATSPMPTRAQQHPADPQPLNPKVLVVSPAAAPTPALKYRLLPSFADLNPGDAAPIYLRIRNFDGNKSLETAWSQIAELSQKWKSAPLDKFPTAEARKFLDLWKAQLDQIEFGAHRRSCDWNYTLQEQRLDRLNVSLSDADSMRRQWARLLALKIRVLTAEGKYQEAFRATETGLAVARHVANGPFVIDGLLGSSIALIMLEQLEDLITRPDAPNLYWALVALPQPFFSFRDQLEIERDLPKSLIPELIEASENRPRSPGEWASLMARMHGRIVELGGMYGDTAKADPVLRMLLSWDLNRFKSEALPAAKEYLAAAHKADAAQIATMSDDQAVALYLAGRADDLWDDLFKASYLPPRDAIPQLEAAQKRIQAAKTVPLAVFASTVPAIEASLKSQIRLDRTIAVLKVIEAIRLYAAAHAGALPETLEQITEVPVPLDPATDQPFVYRAADSAAILHGVRAGMGPAPTYRITIRR